MSLKSDSYTGQTNQEKAFDIRAYEDNEQMDYLAEYCKKQQNKKRTCSATKSFVLSRLINNKTR